MLRKLLIAGFVAVAALASGCASVPMADSTRDTSAKTFAVAPGKANIYVYRNESMGAALKMGLQLDGMPVGETSAKTYFALQVPPGKHRLASTAENESVLEIDTESGRNYFVWQEVKMGFLLARTQLQLVDDATGRAGVMECQLAQSVR